MAIEQVDDARILVEVGQGVVKLERLFGSGGRIEPVGVGQDELI